MREGDRKGGRGRGREEGEEVRGGQKKTGGGRVSCPIVQVYIQIANNPHTTLCIATSRERTIIPHITSPGSTHSALSHRPRSSPRGLA